MKNDIKDTRKKIVLIVTFFGLKSVIRRAKVGIFSIQIFLQRVRLYSKNVRWLIFCNSPLSLLRFVYVICD